MIPTIPTWIPTSVLNAPIPPVGGAADAERSKTVAMPASGAGNGANPITVKRVKATRRRVLRIVWNAMRQK